MRIPFSPLFLSGIQVCKFVIQFILMRNLILLLSSFFIFELSSQNYNILNLTNNDGLSNSSVTQVYQDSKGIMWFGTWDGLNAYNSREFKVYKPEVGNLNSISNNIIRDIIEGDNDILWIATDRGVDRLDRKTNSFNHFFIDTKHQTSPVEHSFLLAKNSINEIFVQIYGQGLFYFDNSLQQFIKFEDIDNFNSRKIFFDIDDNLWIFNVDESLYKVVFKKGFLTLPQIEDVVKFQHSEDIKNVFFDSNKNEVWIQNSSCHIGVYNISKGFISDFFVEAPNGGLLKSMLFFDDRHIWGTSDGLFIYDLNSGKIETIMSDVQVLSLCRGSQQIIWVGTDMHGVWMLFPSNESFTSYTSENVKDFGKSAVRCFTEVDKNELWVGTKGGGIFVFDKKNDQPVPYHKRNITIEDGLLSNSIFTIVRDPGNVFWIGTDGKGLNYSVSENDAIYSLHVPKEFENEINLTSVYSILPDNDNTLWIGTSGYGIYRLKIDRSRHPYSIKAFKQYVYNPQANSLSNNIVYSIIQDDDEHLWIGTRGGGVNKFNTRTGIFQTFRFSANHSHNISNDDILCMHKDKTGVLWIGTSMGLNKLERLETGTPIFVRFTENEGIPNNTIHGIVEDTESNLWLSTNRGIAKLINDNGETHIISYFKKDGLQNNEFSDGAYYKSQNSLHIYFGGIRGFNCFNPLLVNTTGDIPSLYFDAFHIQNTEVNLNDYLKNKNNSPTLLLENSHKLISFRFIPLDYISGTKCEISYMLEGYHKDWIQLGTSSTIVFSNLPQGKYVLKVRGSNADKIWDESYFSLPIIMMPPLWASIWAYIGYFVLIFFFMGIIYWQVKYRITARNNIRLKELEKQKTEEIHQAKLRFFTNIAHEFSNLLTLIYTPCEQLSRIHGNDESRRYVNSIRTNSQRMQSLIQQLIEFRKAETGFLKTEIETIDILELVKYVIDNFIDILEQKKINLQLEFPENIVLWNTDRDGIEKIVFNLVSNAVKYTPNEESIKIRIEEHQHELTFEIKNTGVGIKKANKKIIFDRFKVLERFEMQISEGFETRSGIGLALCKNIVEILDGVIEVYSDEETFTTFKVTLPKKHISVNSPEATVNERIAQGTINEDVVELYKSKLSPIPDQTKVAAVLVIDDDKEIRKLINDILKEKFEVIEACDGKDAIDTMRVRIPQIIVCDVIMPNMNGIEFIRIMKSQELTRHIPIVLLSGRNSIESQIEGISTGADGYLAKPFHPRHLEALIDSLLYRNKAVSDYAKSNLAGLEQYQGKLIHKEDRTLLSQLNQIIINNIDDDNLSLDYIARETAISKMQLYRKIKELTEQTPTEFIRSIRLEQAEQLLKTTNKTVSEIMYCCGFNNKAYFYREFAKKYNKTPKEYRNTQ